VLRFVSLIFVILSLSVTFLKSNESSFLSGGETTNITNNKNSFSLEAKNLPEHLKVDFLVGDALFKRIWQDSRFTLNIARDGLGPLFNSQSCEGCHINDGRGHLPEETYNDTDSISVVIHLSKNKSALNTEFKNIPDENYGSQISEFAVEGILKEADINFKYVYSIEVFNNGMIYELRKPKIFLSNLNYGNVDKDTEFSARISQPLIGLGLIENINADDILKNEDEFDLDNDGISGKANKVWDDVNQREELGRFGWKASQPSIYQQVADALLNDMGLSNPLYTDTSNCTEFQTECLSIVDGNSIEHDNLEVSNQQLELITFYSQQLGVPSRRNIDNEDVIAGKKLFFELSCNACHKEKFETGNNPDNKNLNQQIIYPYSDFLLHDMGEGLADNIPEYLANGNEWRTTPLWGLGLTETVSGRKTFLHDGRARNLIEAILWHGGEANRSVTKFKQLDNNQINQLLKFLDSL
tara:strand:+ start:567 stop:1973 length:1407 start_codon:yes stop_codon:yes gene_type:complete